jgi:tagaturonate epimerase
MPAEFMMTNISKYSMGIGDRFGREGAAQLRAFVAAKDRGVTIGPVWNKSNREHSLIGTRPEDVRAEADAAVRACAWKGPYFVDADHISLGTVDKFLAAADFFTIDVADAIGKSTSEASIIKYVSEMQRFVGALRIPGVSDPVAVTPASLKEIAAKYLFAVEEAGRVYRHIAQDKGEGTFVTEVSFDEANSPQSPAELFFILAAAAREGIPVATVAPKFTGEFLKGIDYVGDIRRFAQEFEEDLAVLAFAKQIFGLPAALKLSIHSGSDKFSLYPIMHRAIKKADAGIHLKTAGTTWLEEVIGLAAAGGEGLTFAKALYREALGRFDEMAKPYATVIAIDRQALPPPAQVDGWSAQEYVETLEHNQTCPRFNIHFRQMVHISFKLAAEKQALYQHLLKDHRASIESHVTNNLLKRHIEPLFLGTSA